MKTLDDVVCRIKGKTYRPLIIGGMGVDISTSDLALEAVRLGAIGHISDAMVPYVSDKTFATRFQSDKFAKFREYRDNQDKSEVKWGIEEVFKAQLNHLGGTMNRKRGDGAVFVNVMEKLTMGAPRETLQARLRGALEAEVDGITLSAGLHLHSFSLIEDHPRFRDAAIGIIVSSARALKVFLRSAASVRRLPDYIVVEGPLAGGHLGFGLDWQKFDLKTIVEEVVALLNSQDLDIPVIPAGGIFTGADAINFVDRGASAVQVATRFVITEECGLPKAVKEKYLEAKEEDIVVNMTSPAGYPMRMLKFSPSLNSNVRPNCEALGYMLDKDGNCSYRDAYAATPVDEHGEKLPVKDKMCICYHFMKHQCYTCGHNVYRLKDTCRKVDGQFVLPRAEQIIMDYLTGPAD